MPVRRVQEVGGGSLIVTLPKKWARACGITKGSLVLIEETPSGVLIVAPAEKGESKVTLRHAPGDSSGTVRKLIAAYLDGHDVIELASEPVISASDRSVIKKAASVLPGLEVMEEEANRLILRCVIDPSLLSPRDLITRMGKLVAGMLRDLSKAIKLRDGEMAQLVVDRDDEVDRIYFLLVRIVRKASQDFSLTSRAGLSPTELIDYRVAGMLLESAADSIVSLAGYCQSLDGDSAAALAEAAESAADLVGCCLQALLERDVPLAVESQQEVRRLMNSLSSIEGGPAGRAADYLGDVLARFIDLCDLVSPGPG